MDRTVEVGSGSDFARQRQRDRSLGRAGHDRYLALWLDERQTHGLPPHRGM